MRHIGYNGELIAEQYLKIHGYNVIIKNYYTRFGEIDIIASKKNAFHIIEVKLTTQFMIHPGHKINQKKKKRMIHCTQLFLEQYRIKNFYIQFDLITIQNESVRHIKNIFNLSDV